MVICFRHKLVAAAPDIKYRRGVYVLIISYRQHCYGVLFHRSIPLVDQVGIHNDLANRCDPFSVVEQFAFGQVNEDLLPPGATGTQLYVTQGWHQRSVPHFTVDLEFVFGTTGGSLGGTQRWATAHVYLDFSESIVMADGGLRQCLVKQLWARAYREWNVSTLCHLNTV
jgi:hypothetical protein